MNIIHLVIQGNGEQNLLSDSFSEIPQKVLVNGDDSNCSKSCNLTEEKNNITLIFNSNTQLQCKNMFNGLENILEVDLSNIDISCRNMDYMFTNCTNLEKITFGNMKSQMEYINSIFYGCSKLQSLNLSNFVFSGKAEMSKMFYGCSSLKYLNLYFYNQSKNDNGQISSTFDNISPNVVYCINNETSKQILLNISKYIEEWTLNYDDNYCYESCKNNTYQYDNICFNRCPNGTLLDNYFCRDNKCNSNNDTTEECIYEQPRGYYFDSYDNIYKKCFNSCDLCYGEGNITNNNCIKCRTNFTFLNEPEFINDGYFQVILKGPNGKLILPKNLVKHVNFNGLQLNERQISALEKMNVEKIEFTHKSYAELFDISLATGKRDLLDLSKKDLVYKKKVKNAYVYYI